jgi:hypothetical protein
VKVRVFLFCDSWGRRRDVRTGAWTQTTQSLERRPEPLSEIDVEVGRVSNERDNSRQVTFTARLPESVGDRQQRQLYRNTLTARRR